MNTHKRKISDIINGTSHSGDDYVVENIVVKNLNKILGIAVIILAAAFVIAWYRVPQAEAPKPALDTDVVVMGCVAKLYGQPADESDNSDSYWFSSTASKFIANCMKATKLQAYDQATGFNLSDDTVQSTMAGCIGAYIRSSNVNSYYSRADFAICLKKSNTFWRIVDTSTPTVTPNTATYGPEITQTPK